jgi:predicted DCC family thiol-disulfide oxidoreductase YuxK
LINQGEGRIRAIAYHDSTRLEEYPQIDRTHADSGVQALLVGQSVVFKDARAIAQCLCQSKSWRWLGRLIDLPPARPFSALGYRIFARNRHHVSRLLGLTACKI